MPGPPRTPAPPLVPAAERVRLAARRRDETDYIFRYWSALGWTILTFGIYGYYVFYQLIRRMRDHNARRLELLDAATTVAWDQAGRQGLQQELAPSFERAAGHLAVLRRMTGDFREPVIWLLLAIVARGIAEIVALRAARPGPHQARPRRSSNTSERSNNDKKKKTCSASPATWPGPWSSSHGHGRARALIRAITRTSASSRWRL